MARVRLAFVDFLVTVPACEASFTLTYVRALAFYASGAIFTRVLFAAFSGKVTTFAGKTNGTPARISRPDILTCASVQARLVNAVVDFPLAVCTGITFRTQARVTSASGILTHSAMLAWHMVCAVIQIWNESIIIMKKIILLNNFEKTLPFIPNYTLGRGEINQSGYRVLFGVFQWQLMNFLCLDADTRNAIAT